MVQQDIGLNSFTEEGFLTFGSSVTTVQLIGPYMTLVSKMLSTALVTSSPIVAHAFLKKKKRIKSVNTWGF